MYGITINGKPLGIEIDEFQGHNMSDPGGKHFKLTKESEKIWLASNMRTCCEILHKPDRFGKETSYMFPAISTDLVSQSVVSEFIMTKGRDF